MSTKAYIYQGSILIILAGSLSMFGAGGVSPVYTWDPESLQTEGDSNKKKKIDLKYPIKDSRTHAEEGVDNPFDLEDPKNVKEEITYDAETGQYIIEKNIGEQFYRNPSYESFESYLDREFKNREHQYWKDRSKAESLLTYQDDEPELTELKNEDRLFGGTTVDIRPQGNIELTFGGQFQNTQNPSLTEKQRRTGSFDFDMNININVVGKIGEKMKLSTSYNTKASFNFENQMKLEYTGGEDEIIKKIEAGNVSFPLSSSLIQGSQSLFGISTQLQFGRLTVSSVISQQKSKAEAISIEGGSQTEEFEISAQKYDVNRHFFLSHFFRDNYNKALNNLPLINSPFVIKRVEVWVTNKQGSTQNTRDIVGFMDLAEHSNIYNKAAIQSTPGKSVPYANSDDLASNSNNLYPRLIKNNRVRSINNVINELQGSLGLLPVQDFEKTYARKLNNSEYRLNAQLGYISLNVSLNADDVLAVSYEYEYKGKIYTVGEFAGETPPNPDNPEVLFLKMLKSTAPRPGLPIWDLMMKNIYSLGAYQVSSEDFILDVYYNERGAGPKRTLPEGKVSGKQIISLMNLDQVNSSRDAVPDGIFDFVEGVTIISQNGRVIFPILEPFGNDLRKKFGSSKSDQKIADNYVFDILYDSTQIIAEQYPELNKFSLRGTYKSSMSSEISLGTFNLPQNSVTVTAGGTVLREGIDYTVDYNLGRIKITNDGVLNSGQKVDVSFESNDVFGFNQKTLFGTRLDYWINDNFTFGGTYMHLSERPYTQKINIGDEPISNAIYGLDANYHTASQFITKAVDKLPFLETKEPSSITLTGEVAHISPGHSKAIGKEGIAYLDDFEGSKSSYELKFPYTSWTIASVPNGSRNLAGDKLFPDAAKVNDLASGYQRAKMNWYNIDPLFLRDLSSTPDHIKENKDFQSDPYVREILENEIFPNKQQETGINTNIQTLDLTFYPNLRGQYNYSPNVNTDGSLKQPRKNWNGIMRDIETSNFEATNVEFVEFWLLDPFLVNEDHEGGELHINLGNISEDILKDSRKLYENGLSKTGDDKNTDNTTWGRVPSTQAVTNSFDNDPDARINQDVGFDGVNDENEAIFFADYIQVMQDLADGGLLDQAALNAIKADPSTDNYHYYRGDDYDDQEVGIIDRYFLYNGHENNSPTTEQSKDLNKAGYNTSSTTYPDNEDLNRDNTLNETEEFFEYIVRMIPGELEKGRNFITDVIEGEAEAPNGDNVPFRWLQFKVPIQEYTNKTGNIQDFRSIRFIRMFLTEFDEEVTMRFAKLELVRNQWRKYRNTLKEFGEYDYANNDSIDDSELFNVTSVSIEENSNYILPPGVTREQVVGTGTAQSVQQNEQSLAMQLCGLKDGDAKAVYKALGVDLRRFETMELFTHAESLEGQLLNPGDLRAFVRIGTDFTENYYEYEIPLLTIVDPVLPFEVWPPANKMEINLKALANLKIERDVNDEANLTEPYSKPIFNQFQEIIGRMTVVGSPDLGRAQIAMIGVRNPKRLGAEEDEFGFSDDGSPKCAEVWFNEFRMFGFDEEGGTAALGRVDVKLADLGQMTVSGSMHTPNWGSLEEKLSERTTDHFRKYDASTTLELGKFLPKKSGIRLPMYASIGESFSTPEYDPYESDVKLKDKLDLLNDEDKSELLKISRDYTRVKSLNFSNVRKVKTGKSAKTHFWDIENWNATYAFTETFKRSPRIEYNQVKKHRGELAYGYNQKAIYIKPFNKLLKKKWKALKLIRDFNFNLLPTNVGMTNQLTRQVGILQLRQIGEDDFVVPPSYDKYFKWGRGYQYKHDITQNLKFDFSANTDARIDEPIGPIDTQEKKDTIMDNLKKFGRVTNYRHTSNVNYTLPLNKLPYMKFLNIRAKYGSSYGWVTSPRDPQRPLIDTVGNTISNAQSRTLTSDLNMKNLYSSIRLLKKYDKPTKPMSQKARKKDAERRAKIMQDMEKLKADKIKAKTKYGLEKSKRIDKIALEKERKGTDWEIEVVKLTKEKKQLRKDWKKDRKQFRVEKKKLRKDIIKLNEKRTNPFVGGIVKPLIALKRVNVSYDESFGTSIPGWVPSTDFLGQDLDYKAPGSDFLIGLQPNQDFMVLAAQNNWLIADTVRPYNFVQTSSNNLSIRANFEPISSMRIDLTYTRKNSTNMSESFGVLYDANGFGVYDPQNVQQTGTFTMTYNTWNTAFKGLDKEGQSPVFKQFEDNRAPISKQLADANGLSEGSYVDPSDTTIYEGYGDGYGPYSQDVLIPAFLASYTGATPDVGIFNSKTFIKVPKPNWRFTYNGLGKLEFVKRYAKTVNITHAYTSTLSVGNFQSNFNYTEDNDGNQNSRETLTDNFVPFYNIQTITINESLSPLIGLDITWSNNMTTRLELKKSRNLTMSFLDYQLLETKSDGFTIGFGYKVAGLVLPFKSRGKKVKLKNDVNFAFNFSYRDNKNLVHRLDQDATEPTSGSKTIGISPRADYVVNEQLNIQLFYDRQQTIPATSASFPITNTQMGIKVRFTLAN